jgi:hypothetical protein
MHIVALFIFKLMYSFSWKGEPGREKGKEEGGGYFAFRS